MSNDADAAGPATVVNIADLPPVGITLNAAPAGGTCTVVAAAAVFPVVGDGTVVVECAIAMTPALQPGDERTITWSATADVSTIGSTPVNHASYNPDGSENPPEPGENCTPAESCTSGTPDEPVSEGAPTLSVVKTAPSIAANTPFVYSFEVSNAVGAAGPATVVNIADLPPVGNGSTVVECAIELNPALAAGQSTVVTWNATADDSTIGTTPVNHASYNPDGSGNPPTPGETCTPEDSCTSGQPANAW